MKGITCCVVTMVLCSVSALADGAKTPEEAIQTWTRSILAKDAHGALSVTYVPDKLPSWFTKDATRYDKERVKAMARELIEEEIDQMLKSLPPTDPKIVMRSLGTCITNRYAVVIPGGPEGEQQSDFAPVFLIKATDGWKLPFTMDSEYLPLLPEDRAGEKEFQSLKEWAEKKIAELKARPTKK